MSISKYGIVILRKPAITFDYKTKISYRSVEYVDRHEDIKHNSVREAIKYLNVDYPLDISYVAEIPSRAGLGSSSTFLVSLLNGLYHLNNESPSHYELANAANKIERHILNEAGGYQDPIWASFGGLKVVKFFKDGNYSVCSILMPNDFIREFEKSIVLCYTGIRRGKTGSDVTTTYSQTDSAQLRILDIAKESIKLFKTGNLERLGRLFYQSWLEKKNISPEISKPEIDQLIQFGIDKGAFGGKLLGAGSGGFAAFIVPPEKKETFLVDMKEIPTIKFLPFKIDWGGAQVNYIGNAGYGRG